MGVHWCYAPVWFFIIGNLKMTLKLPKIIGHRGAAAYAPENTLEGIHTAADMGVEWVELDVKLTKDQIPVLFHDETLERTTNGAGNVADITYDDLKQLATESVTPLWSCPVHDLPGPA